MRSAVIEAVAAAYQNKGIEVKMSNNIDVVEIYTDGACSGNPGPGGWAAVLLYKGTKKKYQDLKKILQTIEWN